MGLTLLVGGWTYFVYRDIRRQREAAIRRAILYPRDWP